MEIVFVIFLLIVVFAHHIMYCDIIRFNLLRNIVILLYYYIVTLLHCYIVMILYPLLHKVISFTNLHNMLPI